MNFNPYPFGQPPQQYNPYVNNYANYMQQGQMQQQVYGQQGQMQQNYLQQDQMQQQNPMAQGMQMPHKPMNSIPKQLQPGAKKNDDEKEENVKKAKSSPNALECTINTFGFGKDHN